MLQLKLYKCFKLLITYYRHKKCSQNFQEVLQKKKIEKQVMLQFVMVIFNHSSYNFCQSLAISNEKIYTPKCFKVTMLNIVARCDIDQVGELETKIQMDEPCNIQFTSGTTGRGFILFLLVLYCSFMNFKMFQSVEKN